MKETAEQQAVSYLNLQKKQESTEDKLSACSDQDCKEKINDACSKEHTPKAAKTNRPGQRHPSVGHQAAALARRVFV